MYGPGKRKKDICYCVMLYGSSIDKESVMGPPCLLPLGIFSSKESSHLLIGITVSV